MLLVQPKAVWATAGASVVAFMGIGLVDPILPSIAKGLDATPSTVYTELALGVSDAPRPVASAGYNFVRWFAAAAAPYFAPKIEEWSSVRVPFLVAAATALIGAVVVYVRRSALTHEAAELAPRHVREDSVTVFAN